MLQRTLSLLVFSAMIMIAFNQAATATVLFQDNFESYTVNQRIPVQNNPWEVHSGGGDEPTVRSAGGSQWLEGGGSNQSADIHADLSGGIISNGNVYAGMDVMFIAPNQGGGYFFHFREGFNLNARVFISPSGNGVRLGFDSDGSSASSNWPSTLNMNTLYRIIIRYNPGSGANALWVDPQNEQSQNLTANGGADPVDSIALRQPSGGGTPAWQVDNLIVADTFNEVLGGGGGATPAITSINPNSGSTLGGTMVTITGTDLTNVTGVTFDGSAASNISVVNATTITATTPGGNAGAVDVTISDGTNTDTLANGFTYTAAAPTITGISPSSGTTAGGTSVSVTGTNLAAVTSVSFGGTSIMQASFTSQSATQIQLATPAGTAGQVDVTISDGTNTDTLTNGFTYIPPGMPSITSINPSSGPASGGTTVTITGSDLGGVTSVSFGANPATNISVIDPQTITADSPAGMGTVDVSVSDGTNSDTLSNAYNYSTQAPSITSINPNSGPDTGGTRVTITGTALAGVVVVRFGGVAGTGLNVVNATTLEITTPAGTVGMVDVEVDDGTNVDSFANGFEYLTAQPAISSITPGSGTVSGGTRVTISGQDLMGITSVTFGSTPGTNLVVNSATSLEITTPPAGAPGLVSVTISDGTNSDMRASGFQYLSATPVIQSLLPTSGTESGGTTVTINGIDLNGVTEVRFGGTLATNLNVLSATQLSVITPAGTGVVDVSVTDGSTQDTLNNAFTYVPAAPMIASVSPSAGSISGGTLVTITGSDLTSVTSVSFGGVAGTDINVVNASTLTCRTPARSAALVAVVIGNGTQFDTLSNAFTFVDGSAGGGSGGLGGSGSGGGGGGCALSAGMTHALWLLLALFGLTWGVRRRMD